MSIIHRFFFVVFRVTLEAAVKNRYCVNFTGFSKFTPSPQKNIAPSLYQIGKICCQKPNLSDVNERNRISGRNLHVQR